MQESPRRRLAPRLPRYLDQRRPASNYGTSQGCAQLGLVHRARGGNTKALGKFHEIRIVQLSPDDMPAEAGLLIAQHIAEAAVVEHQDDDPDAVLGRRGQFLNAE